ncbi:Hypothetical protein A7982_09232 [Minicystis rosea]|nr:Hypothetical protein A7982_09232 [Minicystis rosea]
MTKTEPAATIARPWDALHLSERAGAVRFPVHVRPKSSRSAILGVREGALDVALTAPPADGAANAELVKLLAQALEVRRGDVSIVAGASSRSKLIEVNGTSSPDARSRLRGAAR